MTHVCALCPVSKIVHASHSSASPHCNMKQRLRYLVPQPHGTVWRALPLVLTLSMTADIVCYLISLWHQSHYFRLEGSTPKASRRARADILS